MRFNTAVPEFQRHHSFWGALATIGAVAATVATGGAAAPLIPVASGIGNAIDARNAEKKASQQQVTAADKSAATLAPYNARGTQATNTLAGLLGMPDLPAGTAMSAANPRSAAGNPIVGQAVPRETANANQGLGRLADLGGPTAAQAQTRSSYGPMVQLQSPDGEVGEVPEHEVPHWLKLGARPMGAVQ